MTRNPRCGYRRCGIWSPLWVNRSAPNRSGPAWASSVGGYSDQRGAGQTHKRQFGPASRQDGLMCINARSLRIQRPLFRTAVALSTR